MRLSEKTTDFESEIDWFLDHMLNERGSSKHTLDAYQSDLLQAASFFADLGHSKWNDCNKSELMKYRAMLGTSGLASSSVSRKLSAVRSLLKFLAKSSSNQWVPIEGLKVARKKLLPKALSIDEVDSIMKKPNLEVVPGIRDRAMLEMLYGAGLRVSELITLRLEDCELSDHCIRVLGKREKARIVPLPQQTELWLRKYLDEARPALAKKPSSVLFFNNRSHAWSRSGVFRMLRRYASQAGVNAEIGPHTLRHSYAVHLVQAGADLRSVQELLGHDSISTTEVYTHLDMETVKQVYVEAHPRAKRMPKTKTESL